jgi:hypothetical protein
VGGSGSCSARSTGSWSAWPPARPSAGGVHNLLGVSAAAGLVVGLEAIVLVLGSNPLGPSVLVTAAIAGGIAYVRAAGIW